MIRITPLLASVSALAVTACAAGPDYNPPATPEPDAFSRSLDEASGAVSASTWWSGFEDPTLARVVEAAIFCTNAVGSR